MRVPPDPAHPVHVQVEAGPGKPAVEAKLHNLSMHGTGISLEAEAEQILSDTTNIVISILLPGTRKPVILMAEIRYRRLVGRRIHYGIHFDPQFDNFTRKQNALSKYIVKRQLEFLKA